MLQKEPRLESLLQQGALISTGQDFHSFQSFCPCYDDYHCNLRQKSVFGGRFQRLTSLAASEPLMNQSEPRGFLQWDC